MPGQNLLLCLSFSSHVDLCINGCRLENKTQQVISEFIFRQIPSYFQKVILFKYGVSIENKAENKKIFHCYFCNVYCYSIKCYVQKGGCVAVWMSNNIHVQNVHRNNIQFLLHINVLVPILIRVLC